MSTCYIVSDVDDTFFEDFAEYDKGIIRHIFGKNRLVLFTDKLLQIVKSFDILPNKYNFFEIRMKLYCYITNNDLKKAINEYSEYYKAFFKLRIKNRLSEYVELLNKKGYDIKFTSNNPWASEVISENLGKECISPKNFNKLFEFRDSISWVFGNTYSDIRVAKKLKCSSVCISKSIFARFFGATCTSSNFKNAIYFIPKSDQ
ncbi:MAG: hypothetical protein N2749_03615 [Clostridia bacterium]|nr:hypothetical protein [Clostridia bacterium]